MAKRSLNLLLLAFVGSLIVGPLIGCTAMTEPEKAHTLPDDSQSKYFHQIRSIALGKYLDKHGFLSNKSFIKPLLIQNRSPINQMGLQMVLTTTTSYKKTRSDTKNKMAGEKPPKLPFEIVKHPNFGTLEIRDLKRMSPLTRGLRMSTLTPGSWRSISSGGSTSYILDRSTKKAKDKKPKQTKNFEQNFLRTYTLYYIPTGKLTGKIQGTDEIIVKLPAIGRTKSQLIKYIVTR